MKIALVGAGGKMGRRISPNLIKHGYEFVACEKDGQGMESLRKDGLSVMTTEDAVSVCDYIVFAVPDAAIPGLSKRLVPMMKPGATLITLDPAAARAGKLFTRDDCTFVVTHPTHPPMFYERVTAEEKADMFGGSAATQDIVISLYCGDEEKFLEAQKICVDMFSPVDKCHRITVEQMAILEPAAAEIVIAACATVMKEAVDEAVNRGVPRPAAESFLSGHIGIVLAILFKSSNPFSDAAMVAVDYGKRHVFREDWKKVFEPGAIEEALAEMLHI